MLMLRKKSGEPVRSALKTSSDKRRPSIVAGTSACSKAVHFDIHLEHVRHFFQVDKPMAVSATSSSIKAYDGITKVSGHRQIEWEIVISDFPVETPQRLSLPVRVQSVSLSSDNTTLIGSVAVANLAFHKIVIARFTLDHWKTISDVAAEFVTDVHLLQPDDGYDRFNFNINLADQTNLEAKTMFFCVKYCVNGQEYWDNNNSANFKIHFKKKPVQHDINKNMQEESSRPLQLLRRGEEKPLSTTFRKPKSTSVAFNEQQTNDYLGKLSPSLRLKGAKPAINLPPDSLTQCPLTSVGQALGNRYDFAASIYAAINDANSIQGVSGGLDSAKPSTKKWGAEVLQDTFYTASQGPFIICQDVNKITVSSSKNVPTPTTSIAASVVSGTGVSQPRRCGSPVVNSQLYNQFLEKYCFVRVYQFRQQLMLLS